MPTPEELLKDKRLSSAEMDRVIERASQLQERANLGDGKRSVDAVKAVGKELAIDPAFVDAAMAELEKERLRAEAATQERRQTLRKAGIGAAIALVLTLGMGWLGAGSSRSAAVEAHQTAVSLDTVLRRQAALVPQMLALSGGSVAELADLKTALDQATTVEARAKAADALRLKMAEVMGRLPAAASPEEAAQRTALQAEIVGAENRISTERRRYEESLVAWRAAASGPLAKLGLALGFGEKPPP